MNTPTLVHFYPGPNAARYLCGRTRLPVGDDYGTPDDEGRVTCEACREALGQINDLLLKNYPEVKKRIIQACYDN